ncbi:MAG TPA: ribosomal L7Ae/L30e/S12e/Gadd45 family protein [Longimicrobiales bacterium]|nr:ribosomal L7Ae/L30e/S12e/Gadd45 family protein [Longimicrobiales bacterium]
MRSPSGTRDLPGALGLLGVARRAGVLAVGTAAARNALIGGRAHLVLTAGDASSVQLDKVEKVLGSVPRRILGDRAALGAALGAAPVTAVAVTDQGLAEAVLRQVDEPGSTGRSGMRRCGSGPVQLEDDERSCGSSS